STTAVVDVARGLVLLYGIGTSALPSWDPRMGWSNLMGGLAGSGRQVQADMRTHLIHRPARDTIPPPVELERPPIAIGLEQLSCRCCIPGPAEFSPSTQMRCRITANRRASATMALFMPRRLAICIAQALSQDHLVERTSMLWAAS